MSWMYDNRPMGFLNVFNLMVQLMAAPRSKLAIRMVVLGCRWVRCPEGITTFVPQPFRLWNCRCRGALCLLLTSFAVAPSFVNADDWPQWLGPSREPVWRESGIFKTFPKGGVPLRWRTSIGGGYSGPAVSRGKVFVMDWISETADGEDGQLLPANRPKHPNPNFRRHVLPGKERVVCMRESDGAVLWTHEYNCPYTSATLYAIGPRCTPTVDGDIVYTLGAEGRLLCLRVGDGAVVWSRDFMDDYGLEIQTWGFAAHPLVDGDRLICVVGGENSTCVAFDKRTGKEVWRALSSTDAGYCPPVIREINGERHLIIWHGDSVNGLDPASGELFWSVPFQATFAMTIGAPQLEGQSLFLMCFDRQSAMIQISDDNRSAEIVWEGGVKRGVGGVLNTAILHDGHIYACGHNGRYICAKLKTGERVWSTFAPSTGRRPALWANAFSIQHGDRYFHANDLGDLIIARMTPAGYEEISRTHLIDPTHNVGSRSIVWSHPAFANQSVYLRNDREMRCYSLRAPGLSNSQLGP